MATTKKKIIPVVTKPLPSTLPANPPEKMTVEEAMGKDPNQFDLALVTDWGVEMGLNINVYIPIEKIPKSAKINLDFMYKTGAEYLKGSFEARDALYKSIRKKSWPASAHIMATDEFSGGCEFLSLYNGSKGRFVPCYLVGFIPASKKGDK
jgi:hypothetical protein